MKEGSVGSDDTGPTAGLQVICVLQWPMLSCPQDNRSLRPGLSEEELVLVLVFTGICSEQGGGGGSGGGGRGESGGGARFCSWELRDSWHQVKL